MSRSKLKKFASNAESHNIIEPGKPLFDQIKGRWHELYFKNQNDIVLELACGRGEYTVGLAPHYPDKNFIGIDIKGDRIYRGSTQANERGLTNVAFLRTHISRLEHFFAPGEVSEIWVVFPDPRPKDRDENRRLTCPRYLELYRRLLKPGGLVRLKTDNPGLFAYTLDEVLPQLPVHNIVYTKDLYKDPALAAEHHGITTKYEGIFSEKGFSINYLKFRFDHEAAWPEHLKFVRPSFLDKEEE